MPKRLSIYADGSSRGNPGPAGIGVIVCEENGEAIENISKFIGEATNNVAEYNALIYGLQAALILRADEVIINTDSELLAKQMNREYKIKDADLKRLHEQIRHLLTGFKKFEIKHIDRTENRGADRLANKAVEQQSLF